MAVSGLCVSSHGAVGWSAVYDSGHTHLLLGCMWRYKTDKNASDMIFTPLRKIIKKPALGLNSIQKPYQM